MNRKKIKWSFFAVLSARSKLFTTPAQMPPLHCHAIFATYPDSQSNSNQKGPFGEHIRCWHQGWMSHLDTMKTIDQIYYGGRDLVWLKPGSTLVSLTGQPLLPQRHQLQTPWKTETRWARKKLRAFWTSQLSQVEGATSVAQGFGRAGRKCCKGLPLSFPFKEREQFIFISTQNMFAGSPESNLVPSSDSSSF